MAETDRIRTSLLRRLLLAAGAVLLAVALAEVALRVMGPRPLARTRADYGFVRADFGEPVLVFPPRGVVRYQWDGDPLGVLPPGAHIEVQLNDAGLRGPLPDGRRPCVLFVGDSFTFGEGVTDGAAFPALLAAGPGAPFASINAGVPGYGTREEYLRLPTWLTEFHPGAVVVVFGLNDPISLGDSIAQDDRFMHVEPGAGASRLLALLDAAKADAGNERWYRDYYSGTRSAAWAEALDRLRQMRELSERSGAHFGVVLFPLLHRLESYPFRDLHAEIAQALRQSGVPVLDLLPAFEGKDTESLWVHPTDHHPNAAAHAIAAAAMEPFVRGLLTR